MKKKVGFLFIGIVVGALAIFSLFMFSELGTIVSRPLQTAENSTENDSLSDWQKSNILSGHLCCLDGNDTCCTDFLSTISRSDLLKNDTSGFLPENIAESLGECCLDGISGCCNALQGVVSGL